MPPNHQSRLVTQGATTASPFKAVGPSQFASLLTDRPATGQRKPVGNAIVAHRLGRLPGDEARNVIVNRDVLAPLPLFINGLARSS